ncbi:hypothetical protein [Halococcus agarilyticus]|uniref:hypothetical protein n=1 Tax=Halococcus agarilyticus TaxID=1232219 RepID=UPI001E283506|nr:hypothetical protein [Halococcus agarilyticus]
MPDDDERQLAEDSPPRMVLCQRCSEAFDWREESCPHCGWEKAEWTDEGRYGLARSD